MEPNLLIVIIVGILIVDFTLERILSYLNARHQNQNLPEELSGVYDHEKYRKSLNYFQTNYSFENITSSFSFLLILIVIVTGAFGKLDYLLRNKIQDPIFLALFFFGILFLLSDLINLPFSMY
ncbi:MAG: M48 family peptidase, partial [Cytophagaceae bacterium]